VPFFSRTGKIAEDLEGVLARAEHAFICGEHVRRVTWMAEIGKALIKPLDQAPSLDAARRRFSASSNLPVPWGCNCYGVTRRSVLQLNNSPLPGGKFLAEL